MLAKNYKIHKYKKLKIKMKLFKQGELKLLWPFYMDAFISATLFFMPAFIIVYFRNLGFSLFQISLLTMMMSLSILLFEIPTGAIADIYGRKFSVLLGAIIQGIAMVFVFNQRFENILNLC